MGNPINESGKTGEDRMEKLLIDLDIPYKRSKSGEAAIDFILFPYSRMEDKYTRN